MLTCYLWQQAVSIVILEYNGNVYIMTLQLQMLATGIAFLMQDLRDGD